MPIMTEFKGAQGDPYGKFSLRPQNERDARKERWPSPVILKVIKLDDNRLLKVCFILNHAVPEKLDLCRGNTPIHSLTAEEHPLAFADKTMPENAAMLRSGENSYDALIRHLNLTEVPA